MYNINHAYVYNPSDFVYTYPIDFKLKFKIQFCPFCKKNSDFFHSFKLQFIDKDAFVMVCGHQIHVVLPEAVQFGKILELIQIALQTFDEVKHVPSYCRLHVASLYSDASLLLNVLDPTHSIPLSSYRENLR